MVDCADELDLGESGGDAENRAAMALRQLASQLSIDQDEDGDLGESMSMGVREPEKIEKAKEKARLQMKTLTEAHLGQIKVARKHMQERIQKANDMRLESDRRARQLVPRAEELWESQAKARKRAAERRKKAAEDEAAQRLRREEAAILKEKQQASLDAEARETSVQNKADNSLGL